MGSSGQEGTAIWEPAGASTWNSFPNLGPALRQQPAGGLPPMVRSEQLRGGPRATMRQDGRPDPDQRCDPQAEARPRAPPVAWDRGRDRSGCHRRSRAGAQRRCPTPPGERPSAAPQPPSFRSAPPSSIPLHSARPASGAAHDARLRVAGVAFRAGRSTRPTEPQQFVRSGGWSASTGAGLGGRTARSASSMEDARHLAVEVGPGHRCGVAGIPVVMRTAGGVRQPGPDFGEIVHERVPCHLA